MVEQHRPDNPSYSPDHSSGDISQESVHSNQRILKNPYMAEQHERDHDHDHDEDHTPPGHHNGIDYYGVGSVQRPEDHPSERASQISTSKKSIAQSIKGMMRRSTQGSHLHSDKESKISSSAATNKSEKSSKSRKEEAEEELQKKEDPEHLLDTILEEDEDEAAQPLMTVNEAVEDIGGEPATGAGKARTRGYRANLLRHNQLKKYTTGSHFIKTMRRWYKAVANSSMLARLFIAWFPLALILFIPLAFGAFYNRNMRIGHTRVMWLFIWIEVVWAALWVGKALAHYLPEVFGFFISMFAPRFFKYVDMFVALEFAVQMLIWTFISFITFSPLLTANKDALDLDHQPRWQNIVQSICVAFLVSAIVFMVEQIFMYFLSTNFHKTRMAMRIQQQKKSINVLIILLNLAYKFFPVGCSEFSEEDEYLRYSTIKRAQNKVGGIAKNKVFQKVNKVAGKVAKTANNVVADVSENYGRTHTIPKMVKDALAHRESREVLANRIWKSLVMEDANSLSYDDLLEILGNDKKEEVIYMMDILDSNGQDGIDLDEMIDNVNRIGKESKQIAKSLIDLDGAITKLHHLLLCLCLILIVIIFVGMLAPSSATTLATLGSTILSLSFLFSATAQEVFQSCIFLFVKHPFDVGDWVQTAVAGIGLPRMRVLELNLMYTVFNEIGNNTRRQVSNSVLNGQFIDNITRSPGSQISVVLTIGVPETTNEQLAEFEDRLNVFVEDNPREFAPGVFFQIIDHPDLDQMSLNICINTRNNQDDIVLFSNRRSKAFEYIGQCIMDIPITIPRRKNLTYSDPSLPMFHYNIKDIDQAMDFVQRTKDRRLPAGMRKPMTEEDIFDPAHQDGEYAEQSDHAQLDRASQGSAANKNDTDETQSVKRAPSVKSRTSRTSRAFSSASHIPATGLRSRKATPSILGNKEESE